ncbi:phage holin family protein [Priestia aryabhattai]|uniref:phage holin family protein n=1 Tax=Priestia aryabhattai TaxID=412384 RepID=UPI002E1BEFCB|nr:phage holin family protein [Priestia aryabhattai]
MSVLNVMACLDVITGIAKGIYDTKPKSLPMSKRMIRKSFIVIAVIFSYMIGAALFDDISIAKNDCILFYIGMDGISILENLS